MSTLHTFGCSITQGFALPDIVRELSPQELQALGREPNWTDVHVYSPSQLAWPQLLGDRLGIPVVNHARRGACFQQIARQCAVAAPSITDSDIVIVMWTYLVRLSMQWPARTAVPFCNMINPEWNWRTVILPGFNKFFGLTPSETATERQDRQFYQYIESAAKPYVHPMSIYNHFYNNLVLQTMVDGYLRNTGARVIHLSVEPENMLDQLERARQELDPSLREPYVIPDPKDWYQLSVDHDLCRVIHDPSIPPAKNDMHPSEQHHLNFALSVYGRYFR